jgi:predicted amidophosphoribosyltransferase
MYSTEPEEIFFSGTHGVRRQDKKPPGRFDGGVSEPLTAAADPETAKNLQQNRQTHHGSETRQTANIAGRVPFHIKSEILRIGAMHGWKESYTVRTLVEQALAHSLGEKFAVMIRHTIQEAVKTELQKDREWLRKINMSEYLAAEQGRLLVIDFLRAFLPNGEDVNQKIRESRKNSLKHLKFYFHSISVQEEQSLWPSSK